MVAFFLSLHPDQKISVTTIVNNMTWVNHSFHKKVAIMIISSLFVIMQFSALGQTIADKQEYSNNVYYNKSYNNNLIRYHLLNLIVNEFTISYERILPSGKVGIQIPFTLGYDKDPVNVDIPTPSDFISHTNSLVTKFESGVSVNVYPVGQGIIKYYFGPGLRYGQGYWYEDVDDYNWNETPESISSNYFKFYISNGLIITPVSSFSLALSGYIGIQHAFEATENKTETTGGLSFDLIIRF